MDLGRWVGPSGVGGWGVGRLQVHYHWLLRLLAQGLAPCFHVTDGSPCCLRQKGLWLCDVARLTCDKAHVRHGPGARLVSLFSTLKAISTFDPYIFIIRG